MVKILLLIVAASTVVNAATTCAKTIGNDVCILKNGIHVCPDNYACLINTTDDSKSICCAFTDLIQDAVPTLPSIATTASTCYDRLNPLTNVSDCPARANLCNDATYYDLMTQQCPKTCNRCSGTTRTTTRYSASCQDKKNPSTGVSDCPARANLCNDTVYYDVMTDQCPKTCNRCSSSATVAPGSATCGDKLNPQTGRSDCASSVRLCQDPSYKQLMKEQCPKTCGYCS